MRSSPRIRFVRVGKGYLSLYHRPKRQDAAQLVRLHCTHVVTLLREDEGAPAVGKAVKAAGITWLWRPIPNADAPKGEIHQSMVATVEELAHLLDNGSRILVHCSAGIHRTGMLGYGLLRYMGHDKQEAFKKVNQMRKLTREGMLPRHIAWGDSIARPKQAKAHHRKHTMDTFRNRIRKSIADSNLQIALDNNAQRRRDGRLTAFASVPDYQERRARAHAVKADVVEHLDTYLEKFLGKVQTNGIIIHRAKDADDAIKIILELCNAVTPSQGSPLLMAKAKSMVSEEINLNHVLAEHNIRAIETDLGEYIVQLRGERPSHIITPAVHLRRGDVGKLFEEKLGLPYTEEIPVLTNTARKVLREIFLTADIGLSGVNFGVAETGTLCLVTNEGNGRMCTTIPPVHIALMGMERLVPTMDDLALFLSLLPRSATGQKLSVYTSLINAPLPKQTRHLIVLNNGRSALRESPLSESLFCIRCGACLNACPVFRELGGHAYGSIYPGPIGSVISSALVNPKFAYLSQASSLCGACKEACPVDIDLPGMLLKIRAGENVERTSPGVGLPGVVKFGLKLFSRAAAAPWFFKFAQRTMGLFPLPNWIRIPAFTGWGYSKDFPRPSAKPFHARWKNMNREESKDAKNSIEREEIAASKESTVQSTNLVEQFTTELNALGGKVIRVNTTDAPARLKEFLHERNVDRVLVDDAGAKYVTGIASIRDPDPTIRVGVTGTMCGIAETGSVVLIQDAGHTLTASLLPEIHVAMLKASQLLPTVASALGMPEVPHAAAGVVVTGPSRTADIEMTLTIGVHGPGELIVFLIDDSETV